MTHHLLNRLARLTPLLAAMLVVALLFAIAQLHAPAASPLAPARAEAVCGVKNYSGSRGPFWADGRKIDPGKTAPCGSKNFHTGCAYSAYRVQDGRRLFGCNPVELGAAYNYATVDVR